ncbi:hypothetical protein [Kribbella sp. HUAS MG21]|uniref:Uncharacterized protein n=1 Tax=Kribbella sp. HUAS MG21 TaxID=3160966 RepID=A0AAU7T7V8_9ACTN
MVKRLVRAKYKIKAANIPYRVPGDEDLPARLGAVLSVLYLLYNAGAEAYTRAAELARTGATRQFLFSQSESADPS